MLLRKYSGSFLAQAFKVERDVRVRERLQMMLYLREGKVYRVVAQLLKTSIGILSYWRLRFENEGLAGLHDKPGRGKKSKLRKKDLVLLEKAVDEGVRMPDGYHRGYKTKDARSFIQNRFQISYTPRHCRRLLHRLKYRLKVPRPRHKHRNQADVNAFKRAFKKNEKVWEKEPRS